MIAKRAKLIHDTRFLGLDLILICDQETDSDRTPSLVGIATLGIVDAGMRKQNTQLTVLCMDARTGYVYGVMGRRHDWRCSMPTSLGIRSAATSSIPLAVMR